MTARDRFYNAAYAEGCLEGFTAEMIRLGEVLRMDPVQIREAFRLTQWEAIVQEFRLVETQLAIEKFKVADLQKQLQTARYVGPS